MNIKNHLLLQDDGTPVPFTQSPNMGKTLTPQYLVMHFTGGSSAKSSVAWLTNPKAKASAHFVIGRDGSITQLIPCNRVAWHAGISRWNGLIGMNNYSIGIELDNAGNVTKQADGKWRNALGVVVPASDVVELAHKNGGAVTGWQTYTSKQLESAIEVASTLMNFYKLREIIGHDDIAPGRKVDPGPAFPMEFFRGRVLGREESVYPQYITTTNLNIRAGAGVGFVTLTAKPLTKGTKLELLEQSGEWMRVNVVGKSDLEGWVNANYVKPV
jgi:N-acetylmuramoyl-L-alanine amidase